MSNKKFYTYLEFDYLKLNVATFNKQNNKLENYLEKPYNSLNENKELNFDQIEKISEEIIYEVEKSTGEYVKDIFLMVETPLSKDFKLSIMKNNEGYKITKKDTLYLIQEAKQKFLKFNLDLAILHIIIENYVLDGTNYDFLSFDKNCKKFSIDLKFICFPKDLVKNFEKLFLKQQIVINKFVCSNYVKSFNFDDKSNLKTNCEKGIKIVNGSNKREVVSVPKIIEKTGFFEKLFHLFD
tara:strand:- start:1152 stop:1868 length:717 start_codon:yes stop_codon:yes gene_type:complete